MRKISIGICCYNEVENIELMYDRITQIMTDEGYEYEILFSDNASNDGSDSLLRRIAEQDCRVKVIINKSNFGVDNSFVNLCGYVSGDALITLPCDFQDPPELIPTFLREWEQGYDIVLGQKNRSKENYIKFGLRKLFYKIIQLFSEYEQFSQVTGFGLYDRKALDTFMITQKQDPRYHSRYLASEYGFEVSLVPYVQGKRERGKSSYSLSKYYDFAIVSLVNTSTKPLRIMSMIGLILSFFCMIIALFYFVYKLLNWNSFDVGMAPLVIGLFFVSGIQLFSIGLLGEYISVLIRRVTKRPLVLEKEKINLNS